MRPFREKLRRKLRRGHQTGCRPNPPDSRDRLFKDLSVGGLRIPRAPAGLRPTLPGSPRDQGPSSRCVAYAFAGAIVSLEHHLGLPYREPSKNYMYDFARAQFQPWDRLADEGCYIRSAAQGIRIGGAPDEEAWPSDLENINTPPPVDAMGAGYDRRGLAYYAVTPADTDELWTALETFPVVFGMDVTDDFMRFNGAGVVATMDGRPRGGHAMVMPVQPRNPIGPWVLNSWGWWGDLGWCQMTDDLVHWRARDLTAVTGWNLIKGVKQS